MKYIKSLIYGATLAGIALFLYLKRDELLVIASIPWYYLMLLIITGLLPVSINAILFRNNIKVFRLSMPFSQWYGLTVSNTMYNYLLPARGGLALRALYLKRFHNFPYTQYISFTAGVYMLNLFNAALLATFLSAVFLLTNQLQETAFFIVSIALFLVALTGLTGLYFLNPNKVPEKHKLTGYLKKAAQGLQQFKDHPRLVGNLLLLQLTFLFAISLRLYLAFFVLDIPVNYFKVLLINAIVVFSMVFSITPGNIGIKEGIIGLSSSLLGISGEQALLGAVLDRIVAMLIIFVLGAVFSRKLLKNANA